MRTDIHKPSVINPDDYVYVCAMSRGEELVHEGRFLEHQRRMLEAHMKSTGGHWSEHKHGGSCHVCGASFIDHAVFYHPKSGAYIMTGLDCADKLGGGDKEAFRKIRDERQALAKAKAGKMKAAAILKELGIYDEIEAMFQDRKFGSSFEIEDESMFKGLDQDLIYRLLGDIQTIQDMFWKLVKYGSLSEKQEKFMVSLVNKIKTYDQIQEKRNKERENAAPAPEGKVEVTGEVLSTKWQENAYGGTLKMLVKDDRGFKVWTSVPKSLFAEDDFGKGVRVRFMVTLEQSKDDHSFAFGKRPTKARMI